MTRTIELIAVGLAVLIAALGVHAWLAARDDQRLLQSTLAAQKQLIDAADARETSRDATLQQTLAQIDALKHTTLTPAEILRDLPKYLPLPAPIALTTPATAPPTSVQRAQPRAAAQEGTGMHPESSPAGAAAPASSTSSDSAATSSSGLPSAPSAPSAEIPASDLKPLYDYVQDCRACQARLAVATQNISDDDAKIAGLTRERDAAIIASKGGGFWQRFRRNAWWLAVGAGLGYAAHR